MTDPRYWAALAVTGGLYVGAGKLGVELHVAHGVVTPVWVPTGIALAALILFGPRLWPAVAIGALIVNATSGVSLGVAAGIAAGNTLEAAAGAYVLHRLRFRPALDRVRDVIAFVLLAAAGATTLSATGGVTLLFAADELGGSYGSEWVLWWFGDAAGAMLVAPLLLVWISRRRLRLPRLQVVEALVLFGAVAGVSYAVFLGGGWRYPYFLFPLLVWAPLRFGQLGATTSAFIAGAFATAGTVLGDVPIGATDTEGVQIMLALVCLVAVSLLIAAATLTERRAPAEALATVSHELRTPLTGILGFAVTLRERRDLPEGQVSGLLDQLVVQAERLDRLLTNLLDLDRHRRGVIEPRRQATELAPLVEQSAAAHADAEHTILVDTEPLVANVDPTMVERIVDNLVANAVKHTPTGTRIEVSLSHESDDLLLVVTDDGPGIPAADHRAVFEIFNRGSSPHAVAGAGVGLSIVARFAELHGGRAWIESVPSGGAAFHVLLPDCVVEPAGEGVVSG